MPFALLIIGVVLLASAVRNTSAQLGSLLKGDFTGQNNFIYWTVAILLIGAVGYVPTLRNFSRLFLALVVLVLFLKKGNPSGIGGGFFNQFSQAIGTTQQAAENAGAPTPGSSQGSILTGNFLQPEEQQLSTLIQG